jgi:hypothetical protein
MSEPDWPSARAAWQQEFAGREDSPYATWTLARIEECWADSLFFSGESGAAPHFQTACAALLPPGRQWTSREEYDRRMEAHQRITAKLYAIDPYGKARASHDGVPHPDFRPEPPKPTSVERREAVVQLRRANTIQQTEWAALFRDAGHWQFYELAMKWREAGEALAAAHPDGARRAFAWSLYYFERYNRDWTAHLPASRWDSDGNCEMAEVQELSDALADADGAALPGWVESLLAGEWLAAHSTIGVDAPSVELQPLAALLDEARRAADQPR